MSSGHIPVLAEDVKNIFHEKQIRIFVDGTLGLGGHAEMLLQEHPEIECFIGIDCDEDAIDISKERLSPWKEKIHFFNGNFISLSNYLKDIGVSQVDGILIDLGVSSMQLDTAERGFSFLREGPLDMRMGADTHRTAKIAVNRLSEKDLGKIFKDFGEERKWRIAAKGIVAARKKKPINSTKDLVEVLLPLIGKNRGKIHPLTRVFQALRIYVNQELENLEFFLTESLQVLRDNGRMVVISFHSLEDRIVKYAFRDAAKQKMVKLITKKPIVATRDEMRLNKRARSAKLRAVEKFN